MKRTCLAFLVVFFSLYIVISPAAAESAGFTLVNGVLVTQDTDLLDARFLFKDFFSGLRITAVYSPQQNIYTLSGTNSAGRSGQDGDISFVLDCTGTVSGNYDPQTGRFNGTFYYEMNEADSKSGITLTDKLFDMNGEFSAAAIPGDDSVRVVFHGINKRHLGYTKEYTFEVIFSVQGVLPFGSAGDAAVIPAGESCTPTVSGLTGLKPGDTLSPSASYFDVSGAETEIIQDRWFINGFNTPSIIWDGKPVKLELQWTCKDNSAYTQTFDLPAYQAGAGASSSTTGVGLGMPAAAQTHEQNTAGVPDSGTTTLLEGSAKTGQPAAESAEPEPASSKRKISPLGIGGMIAGILALGGFIGDAVFHFRTKPGKAPAPVKAPVDAPGQPGLSTPKTAQPAPAKESAISAFEAARLDALREEMVRERESIKARWRQTREAVAKLKTLKKKNMLKFLMKQGLEVNDWILNSPVDAINKLTVDPLMEKVFEKHDTSQDSNIIVSIHNRIESLEAEMQEMTRETRHLNQEIAKIEQKLKSAGK